MNRPRLWKFLALTAVLAAFMAFLSSTVQNRLAPLYPADKRRPIGAIELPRLDGSSWSLAEHRGGVVLVNFWATWCPPCRTETPDLVRLYNRYSARGFTVAGVAMDDDPEAQVPPFVARYKIPYPIVTPTDEFALAAQVQALPTSLLLDAHGRVAAIYRGAVTESGLSARIETLLEEAGR